MRYFTQAREKELLDAVMEKPDDCLVVPAEAYRDDGNVVVYRNNRPVFLHRRLFEIYFGRKLSRGEFLIQTCGTDGCVNPLSGHREVRNSPRRDVATHCPRGHEYPDGYRDSRGRRRCLECRRLREGYTGTGSPTKAIIGDANRSKRFCPRGHEYTPENTYLSRGTDGYTRRSCRTCKLDKNVTPVD